MAFHAQALTTDAASEYARSLFAPRQSQAVGVEIELFQQKRARGYGNAATEPPLRELSQGLRRGLSGRLTMEPGGQIELSSRPAPDLTSLAWSVSRDMDRIQRRLHQRGVDLTAQRDLDSPLPDRVLRTPRYDTMERYFEPWRPNGQRMMRATASLQVNVDVGSDPFEVERRWRLLYAVGPALVAAFANSPSSSDGELWRSGRLRVWLGLDPSRTGVPWSAVPAVGAAPESYAEWALDAPLMLVRQADNDWRAPTGVTFREWIDRGEGVVPGRRPADLYDLELHLSTLFPFVRPRSFFEVRYLDMPPKSWWIVPTAVIYAITSSPAAADQARSACIGLEDRWRLAARDGVGNADLRRAAERLLELAARELRSDANGARWASRVDEYRERWTSRGRSPADDRKNVENFSSQAARHTVL